MGADLSVDLEALARAAATLLRASHEVAGVQIASALVDAPVALPSTDTAAACVDIGRRLGAGALAYAGFLEATADAVALAARTYLETDAQLAARVAIAVGSAR